jgi:hypothetical protein
MIQDDWIKELESCYSSSQVFVNNLRCLGYRENSTKISIEISVVFI